MDLLPNFVDMAETPEEIKEDMAPMGDIGDQPIYPWGLRIRFTEKEIEKLGLDEDVEVGDMLHMFCLVRVCGVSKNETVDGCRQSVEMQITHIACESEDDENEEMDAGLRRAVKLSRMYKE